MTSDTPMGNEAQVAKLLDTFALEALHEDLVPHVRDSEAGWRVLHHPYVITVGYVEHLNKIINQQYLKKKMAIEIAIKNNTWSTYVALHERPYRVQALEAALELGLEMGEPKEVWGIIGSTWQDSENIYENYYTWQSLWDLDVPNRHFAMDEEERETLAAMPDEFPIWRGFTHKDAAKGMSWTINRDRAVWFARRTFYQSDVHSYLATGKVKKQHVLAHFTGRNEHEIVVLPEHVNFSVRKMREIK